MPVKFHPHCSVDQLETIIIKEDGSPLHGEINIYRKLFEDLSKSELEWDVWHDIRLPEHSDISNYYKKTSAQIDFLILCKYGMLVLEVKGGPISTKMNKFYYGKNFDTPMSQNPFYQAEGYMHTLRNETLNNIRNCFFTYAVAFPHVDYPFEAKTYDTDSIWTEYTAQQYDNSIESFILKVIDTSKRKHKRHNRLFQDISPKEHNRIRNILSPIIYDNSSKNTVNTLEWLGIRNIDILEGLQKNPRIMIEGPPGSGKTTIAKAFIDQQRNKEGIYICWNNLLMHYTKSTFEERNLNCKLEVTTFFQLIQKHNIHLSYEELTQLSEAGFYDLVEKTLQRLETRNELKQYDFIVVDEAQDLFDRGIDVFINKSSGFSGNGLNNGNSLILYDIDQSYSLSGRDVTVIADLLAHYYAHFKLNETRRSAQNPNIRKLSSDILDNPSILLSSSFNKKYDNITLRKHEDLNSVKTYLVRNILNQIRDKNASLKGKDCIVLIESTFLRGSYKGDADLRELLIIRDVEELNKDNINDTSNKLRYSSILKFKGLEKKNVILIISEPSEFNKYEIFVGITRAILNVEINIIL